MMIIIILIIISSQELPEIQASSALGSILSNRDLNEPESDPEEFIGQYKLSLKQ